MIKKIDSILIDDLYKGLGTVYIFGAGEIASYMMRLYEGDSLHLAIKSFIVSEKSSNPSSIRGVRVVEISDLPNGEKKKIVLAVIPKYHREIIELLEIVDDADIYVPSEYAIEELCKRISNLDTKEYYDSICSKEAFFRYIEVETINRCNGGCQFCPVNRYEKQRPLTKMDDGLFKKIIEELHDLDFDGEIGLFSNNEPFIDTRIEGFAEYARNKLPKAFLYLFTNGTLLTKERFERIIPYLNKLQIDIYADDDVEEPSNVKELRQIVDKENYGDKVIFFKISPDAIRYTRAGNAPNAVLHDTIDELCRLPLVQAVIRPDGKLSLCCNDALGQITMGDVSKNSLKEIWNSQDYMDLRAKIMEGRGTIALCKYCDSIDRRPFI